MADTTFFGAEEEEEISAAVPEPVFFASSEEEDASAADSPETAEFDGDTPPEDLPSSGEDGKPIPSPQGESPIPLVSKDEAKAKGEMGITEAARNDYEAATGADAPENPVLAQTANMGLSVGGRLNTNLQMKAAQRLASGEEMSDGDVDSAFDMMQFGVAAPFAATGRAIAGGFRSKPSAILHEWDETEGRRIADPDERGRARRAYAAQIAADFIKERTAVKQNARTEGAARERTHGANIVTGGLAQLGYTAPYILGPAGIAAQFLEEGSANAAGYSNDEYGYDENGRFRLAAKGDDAGRAALAGFGTAGIETAAEVALGRLGGAVFKRGGKLFLSGAGGILSKVPFAREIGGKVAATRVGKAVGAFAGGMSKAFKWTNKKFHLGGFGEENLEEYEGAVLNALTGWDRRESELVDDEGSPTTALSRFVDAHKEFFSPKNMLELNEAMLITMGGGAFVAKCAQRRASKQVDNLIREHHLMPEEELGNASLETKAAALDSYLDNLTEAETVERLDRANGWLGRFTDAIAGDRGKFAQEVADVRRRMDEYHDRMMGEELDRLKVPPQEFSIPTRTGADGKAVPDFKTVLQTDAKTGKTNSYRGVVDGDSGITLTDNGVTGASAYTVHSPDGRRSHDFATLDEAVADATRMKNEIALERARDELKRQYVAGTVESQFKGATVVDVKTAEEAVRAGIEIAGVDVSKDENFDPSRRAWKLPDGTVLLVRDNVHSPAEVETVLRHEIVGHGEEAMTDKFMNAAERGNEGVRTRKAYGVKMGAGEERALREAVANTIQRRSHHADSIDKFAHGVRNALRKMGVDLKMNDADFETEVARMEREIREGEYGLHESKPMVSASAFSETAQEAVQETPTPSENAVQETPTPSENAANDAEHGGKTVDGGEKTDGIEKISQNTASPSREKPVSERTVVEKMTDESPVVELDTAEVSNDDTRIPNFKEGANPETGEVDPLRGEPYDLVSNPIVVMEFKDGKKVVVTGRHRLALYKRAGRAKISARVIREADGWTVDDAKSIDAIANIIDEKGTVKDYVRYFDGTKPTRTEAESGGFLARPKGKLAFGIVEGATADTRAAVDFDGSGAEGLISPEQAGIIAEAAPKDAHPRFGAVQKILVRQAAKGLRGTKLKILARSLAEEVRTRKSAPKQSGETQLDLFTSEEDVELLKLEERRADYRAKKANEYRRVAENLRTAMRKGGKLDLNAEYARELGITDPKDRAQLKAARDRAAERAHYWEEAVRLDDADKAAMDAELGVKTDDGSKKGFALESATSEQLKEEERKRAEKQKIKALQDRPLKGGKMEVGQSLLDLGGAEGEDLFNRTLRQEEKPDAEKEASEVKVQEPHARGGSEKSVERHSMIDEGRKSVLASPNARTYKTGKSGTEKIVYTPKDGGEQFTVGKNAFEHSLRGQNAKDNVIVGRHLGEALDASVSIGERSENATFRITPVKIGGVDADVLFTIVDGKMTDFMVLKGFNTKKDPKGMMPEAIGDGAAKAFEVRDESLANLERSWQERFKPGLVEHARRSGKTLSFFPKNAEVKPDAEKAVVAENATTTPKSSESPTPERPKEYTDWLAKYKLADTDERFAEWQGKQKSAKTGKAKARANAPNAQKAAENAATGSSQKTKTTAPAKAAKPAERKEEASAATRDVRVPDLPKTVTIENATPEDVAQIIADRYAQLHAKDTHPQKSEPSRFMLTAKKLLKNIREKNADILIETIANGLNPGSLRAFEVLTGIKMPRTQREQHALIDKFCGITPEERAKINAERKAAAEKKWADELRALKIAKGEHIARETRVRLKSGRVTTMQKLLEEGWDVKKARRGATTNLHLVAPDGSGYFRVNGEAFEYAEDFIAKRAAKDGGEGVSDGNEASEKDLSHLFGKTAEGTPKTPSIKMKDAAAENATPVQKAIEKPSVENDLPVNRMYSRKPIAFRKPIEGKTGAKIVSYVWVNKKEEYIDRRDEDRVIYVSDWENSEPSDETKRLLVHQFNVQMPDGNFRTVSAETAAKLLGVSADEVKGSALKQIRRMEVVNSLTEEQRKSVRRLTGGKRNPDDPPEKCRSDDAISVLKNGAVRIMGWRGEEDGVRDRWKWNVVTVSPNGSTKWSRLATKPRPKGFELEVSDFAEATGVGHGVDFDSPELDAARREYDEVVARYTNPDGTRRAGWMKAPNGRPTNLTERQWVQVRTPSFKKWFGDWEREAVMKGWHDVADPTAFLEMPAEDVTGVPPLVGKAAFKTAFAKWGEVRNETDGRIVTFPNASAGKMERVGAVSGALNHLFEKSRHAWSEEDDGRHNNIAAIHHYVAKALTADGELFIHFTVREDMGAFGKVHAATVSSVSMYAKNAEILPGKDLATSAHENTKILPDKNLAKSARFVDGKIAYFLGGINPSSVSKVVDENGEPKVVYHATDNAFTVFDRSRLGENTDRNAGDEAARRMARLGFWFNEKNLQGKTYQDKAIAAYVDIKNPYETTFDELWDSLSETSHDEFIEDLNEKGYDGIVLEDTEFGGKSFVLLEPSQVKSATDNTGAFSQDNPDINFDSPELDAENAPSGRGTGQLPDSEPTSLGAGTRRRAVTPQTFLAEARRLFPDVAFRGKATKRMAKWAAGHFEPAVRAIRARDMNAIGTVCHELGHDIEHLTRWDVLRKPAVKRDLSDLGHHLYGPNGPKPKSYMAEGFAEYVRGYVVNAQNLHAVAPDLDDWFKNEFRRAHPEIVKKLDRLRDMVQTVKEQSSEQLVQAYIKPSTDALNRVWDKASEFFSAQNWNDSNSVILHGMRKSGIADLLRWQDEFRQLKRTSDPQTRARLAKSISDKVESDPYIFTTTVRGTSDQRVMDMALHGTTSLLGNEKTGESLNEIFADFTRREREDWKLYAVARHGLENYFAKGLDFGLPKEVLKEVVAKFGSQKFDDALDRYTAYSHRVLHLGVDAGLLSQEAYDEIVKKHPIYVRITRRHGGDGASASAGGRAINRRTGGFDHILDPVDALLMDHAKFLRACFQAKTLQLIVRAGERAQKANIDAAKAQTRPQDDAHHAVAANWPVRVPNAQEAVTFSSAKLKKQLDEAVRDFASSTGADPIPLGDFVKDLTQDNTALLTVFRDKPSRGKHNLVSVYVEGKLQTYELPDMKWADMLTGISDDYDAGWLEKAAGVATKGIRLGATTLNPAFAVRNAIRDSWHASVVSENGSIPFLNSVFGILEHLRESDAAEMFRAMGGHMSDLVGVTREQKWSHGGKVALAQNAADRVLSYGAADWLLLKPFVKAFADVLSLPEIGPRIFEMSATLRKCRDAGLSDNAAALLAMGHAKDVSIDFQRAGVAMRRLNRVIPFLNAAWRGQEQFARAIGIVRALPHEFEDRRGRKAAMTAMKGVAFVTTAGLIAALLEMSGDDDDKRKAFERQPGEKWEYFHFGDWRIPQPFESGYVFASLPRAIVYEMNGDKGAVAECLKTMVASTPAKYFDPATAIASVSLATPALGVALNKDYRGRPIVPQHIKDGKVKEDWYTDYTTEMSKRLGAALGQSPAQLEYVLNGHTGGLYRRVAVMAENFGDLSRLAEGRGLSFIDTLRERPNSGRLVNDFYESYAEAVRKFGSGRISLEEYGRLKAQESVRKRLSELSEMRRAARADTSVPLAERDHRVDALAGESQEVVRAFNDAKTDYRRLGIAHAAARLTGSSPSKLDPADKEKFLGLLKGVTRKEAEDVLVKFGHELVPTKTKGVETFHLRWSQQNVRDRVGRLRTIMKE